MTIRAFGQKALILFFTEIQIYNYFTKIGSVHKKENDYPKYF